MRRNYRKKINYRRKRNYRKRYGNGRGNIRKMFSMNTSYNKNLMPPRFKSKAVMEFTAQINMASIVGPAWDGFNYFWHNNPFQPLSTGLIGGSLPMTFSGGQTITDSAYNILQVLGVLYQSYRVFGSSLSLEVQSGPIVGLGVCITPVATNLPATFSESMKGACSSKTIICLNNRPNYIKSYCSSAKLWGVNKKTVAQENDYAGNSIAGPINSSYWQVGWCNNTKLVYGGSIIISCKLVHYLELFDKIENLPVSEQEI